MGNQGPSNKMRNFLSGLWRVSVHPVTFVVLSILWCLDLAGGSVAAYFNDPQYWQKMDAYPFNLWLKQIAPRTLPISLWVYVMVVLSYLMVLSLLLCTLNWLLKRRKKLKSLGEVLVHFGFLLIFAGFVGGSVLGHRSGVLLEQGRTQFVEEMGIRIQLNAFDVLKSPGGRPLDTVSEMTVFVKDRKEVRGTVRANHPLVTGSTIIYPPDDFESGVTGAILGTSTSGAVTVRKGLETPLRDGRFISIGGVLQQGQQRGRAVGPGVWIMISDGGGRAAGSAFLSSAPGMRRVATLRGVTVTLGQFIFSNRGFYRVHHDPGVWLVIAGSIILALGTVWALLGFMGIIRDPERQPDV